VHHVQTANDLRAEWFDSAQTVGITAGTSTPDPTINEVEERLREFTARGQEEVPSPDFNFRNTAA
jgi:4-hydroxy-3-methylbut-2-enyl diphosphate reductase